MAFDKMGNFAFNHASNPDKPNKDAATNKAEFDSRGEDLKTALNKVIDLLNATTDGASGADNLGMTPIPVVNETANNAQAVIEALVNRLQSVTDSTSGADFLKMTPITETGSADTVQSVIESLITKLKAVTDSASGADLIGATAITGLTGETVQALLEALKSYGDNLAGVGRTTETVKGNAAAIATHMADTTTYSTYKLNPDSEGIFTEIQYKRPDGTLIMKSVLSGGTSPQYTTRTETEYEQDGTTVKSTRIYTISYDADGNVISEVLQ